MTRRPLDYATLYPFLEDECMGRRRYQRPTVKRQSGGQRDYWCFRYRHRGRRPERFVGYCPTTTDPDARRLRGELTQREAQRIVDGFIAKINRSNAPLDLEPRTLEEFGATYWLTQHVESLGAGTQRKYLAHWRNHILPAFGRLRLSDVTGRHVQGFVNDLRHRRPPLSWNTRADILNVLSSIFTKADQWGARDGRHPCKGINLGQRTTAREKRILTPAETARLLAALDEPARTIIDLLDVTGCRISEILGLQEQHIDYPHLGWAMISQRWYRGSLGPPKTAASRRAVPLLDLAAKLRLACRGKRDRYLFERDPGGDPWDDRDLLARVVRPVLKDLGLWTEGLGWHSFRRKTATELQEQGASSIEAGKVLGQGSAIITAEYTVLQQRRIEELARRRRGETVQ